MARNPFTPTFGVTPPLLVGRDHIIADFGEGLDDGPGSPARAVLVTGARGSGKTVMLNALEDEAVRRGWRVLSMSARRGMLHEAVYSRLPEHLSDELGQEKLSTLTGVKAAALGFSVGISRDITEAHVSEPDFRTQLTTLAEETRDRGAGVLITIDEIHRSAAEDLRTIAQDVQHTFREGRDVAIALAGLPDSVSNLLTDDVLTFIRRAERHVMGSVDLPDVRDAIGVPLEREGRLAEEGALDIAVAGTQGFPFLIQSVGYEMWRGGRGSAQITREHAETGVEAAIRRVGRLVHEPSLAQLSITDRSFLAAMAVDDGTSRMRDIVSRMKISSQYANVYRSRLMGAEIIESPARGHVDFTIPYLRDYLREHVARYAIDDSLGSLDEVEGPSGTEV